MKITSSYKIKLTGDLKALDASINIYRDTLRVLIPIINDNWDKLDVFNHTNRCFLNAGLKHFSPEEIYDKLQNCASVRDCLRALNITYADIQAVSDVNEHSDHKVINN